MMDDREKNLAADLRQRKTAAWCSAYDIHAGEVYGVVYHLVGGDRLVAEEICQETWLAGMDRIDQFDACRGTFRSWVFGIARQRVALHFRRLSGKEARFAIRDDDSLDAPDGSLFPEEVLERIERADAVRAAILMLAEDRRVALTAKYVDGLSVEQIATRTGKSAKAIESLLTRSRVQMRSLLRWYFSTPNESKQKEPSDGRSTVP